jgi:glycerophosphoryl diester phosphodiesterase
MSYFVPENTLWSLEAAHLSGAAGSETDITLTRDGVIVCVHEYNLQGFTNGTGNILELHYSDLKNISVTRKSKKLTTTATLVATSIDPEFVLVEEKILALENAIITIPTLEEFLKTSIKLDFFVIIELKPPHPLQREEFLEKFVDLIHQYNLTEKILVQSFFPDLLYLLRRKEPALFTMLLFAPNQLSKYCLELERDNIVQFTVFWKSICLISSLVDGIAEVLVFKIAEWIGSGGVILEHNFLSEDIMKLCKTKNFLVGSWTVNAKDDKFRVRNLGVDFIISDCPTIHC